jgi:hypothetical protein
MSILVQKQAFHSTISALLTTVGIPIEEKDLPDKTTTCDENYLDEPCS